MLAVLRQTNLSHSFSIQSSKRLKFRISTSRDKIHTRMICTTTKCWLPPRMVRKRLGSRDRTYISNRNSSHSIIQTMALQSLCWSNSSSARQLNPTKIWIRISWCKTLRLTSRARRINNRIWLDIYRKIWVRWISSWIRWVRSRASTGRLKTRRKIKLSSWLESSLRTKTKFNNETPDQLLSTN